MKTRKQLIEEIIQELGYGGDLTFETIPEIINKVVETCEEAVLTADEGYRSDELGDIIQTDKILENLKKLKSK